MKINGTYSFTTYSPGYLGDFNGVFCAGIVAFGEASGISDVTTTHNNIYPSLPAGTNKDPTQLVYYIVQTPSGKRVAIADDWIVADSLTVLDNKTLKLSIGGCSLEDAGKIVRLIQAEGYTVKSSTFI